MNTCPNVMFEAFMDCMGNIWSSPKKMHFLTKPTQLTKQERMFPYLQPTRSYGQIFPRLVFIWMIRGHAFISMWSLEWNKISEVVCWLNYCSIPFYFKIGLYAVLQSLGFVWRGDLKLERQSQNNVIRNSVCVIKQDWAQILISLTSHLDEFRQGTWLLGVNFPICKVDLIMLFTSKCHNSQRK